MCTPANSCPHSAPMAAAAEVLDAFPTAFEDRSPLNSSTISESAINSRAWKRRYLRGTFCTLLPGNFPRKWRYKGHHRCSHSSSYPTRFSVHWTRDALRSGVLWRCNCPLYCRNHLGKDRSLHRGSLKPPGGRQGLSQRQGELGGASW